MLSGTAVISMQDDEAAVQGVFGLPNKEPMAILERVCRMFREMQAVNLQHEPSDLGVSQNLGYLFLGVPMIRIIVYWDLF